MSKNHEIDDDLFDAALDAAELEVKEKAAAEPEEPEAPAVEEAEEEAVEEPVEAKKASEPDPKATKEEHKEAPTPAVEEEAEIAAAPEAKQVEDPPFWSSKDKQLLAKAPPEVREIISRKEAQRNEWVNRVTAEAEEGRALARKTVEAFEPYREELTAQGIKDLPGAIGMMGNMLGWNSLFNREPITAINALIKEKGLTLQDFFGEYDGAQQPQYSGHSNDPRVEQAIADAQEAKRLSEEYRQQIEQQRERLMESEISQFRNGTDSQGNSREQFARLYSPQISQVYSEIVARNPGTPLVQALDEAYETVLSQARAAHGVRGPASSPQNKASAQVKRAQAAASSLKGGPSSGVGPGRKKVVDLDDAINQSFEELGFSD
jgi:hypothetical protein